MIMGFVIWSIVAVILLGIGISCRKSEEAVGFFTFVKQPVVNNVERYNHAVSILWIAAAGIFELIGIPFLFLEQNSPLFVPVIFAVIIWVLAVMIGYGRIEGKYKG
ncbi:MAG: hypothetical protein NC126_10600 [Clostridium sp.]|nr:hypothetical protein [Clostridium sp.]